MAAALPAVAGSVVSGIIGQAGRNASSGASGAQEAILRDSYAALQKIGLPPDQSAAIIKEQFKQAGILTPESEQAILAGPSKMAGVKADQGLVNTQKEALQAIAQRGKVGLAPEDRAAMNQLREQVAQDEEAKRQQIMQSMQARGMGGAGAELAAQLQSSQSSTNRAAQGGDVLAGQASQRALQALSQSGTLAGNIRNQDVSEQAMRAQAEDQLNRFNTTAQQQAQQRNVQARNTAQEANLINQQTVSNKNVDMANAEKLRQLSAQQAYWDNKYKQATGQQVPAQKLAENYGQQATNTQNQYANLGETFRGIATEGVKAFQKPKDETTTKNTTDDYLSKFASQS